jgi:hypothetical protein
MRPYDYDSDWDEPTIPSIRIPVQSRVFHVTPSDVFHICTFFGSLCLVVAVVFKEPLVIAVGGLLFLAGIIQAIFRR